MSFLTPPRSQQLASQSKCLSIDDPIHVFDPIHNYIEWPIRIKPIIDTPHFQRLRHLHQLGTSYYVFPGATHRRFEHSIGVMHLARKLLKHLDDNQPELNITKMDYFCVGVAGLLHDLGHGPFSHVFDNEFIPSVRDIKPFKHEQMSVALIADLFKSNKIEISGEELLLIQALVSPSTHENVYKQYKNKKKGFLFEIIANDSNGIDVDKWDYFMRDSQMIGIGISFTYDRLMKHSRVIEDHICYADKCSFELYLMFRTRYELFKRVYSHKAGKCIEYMICDILKLANNILKITENITDPQKYLQLTDEIIYKIQFYPVPDKLDTIQCDKEREGYKQLILAKELIHRLNKRELYKCCGYILLAPELLYRFNNINKQNILNYDDDENKSIKPADSDDDDDDDDSDIEPEPIPIHQKIKYKEIERKWASEMWEIYKLNNKENNIFTANDALKPSDIIIQLMSLSFGNEKTNPIEQVFLYNSASANKCQLVQCDQISTLQDGSKFREVMVRGFVKKNEYKIECQRAFKQLLINKNIINDHDEEFGMSTVLSPRTKKHNQKRKTKYQKCKTMQLIQSSSSPSIDKKIKISVLGKRNRGNANISLAASTDLDIAPRNKKSKK